VLVSGIRGIQPGRFYEERASNTDKADMIRTNLQIIRDLGDLIEREVRIDYQKKILDLIIKIEQVG
jgi:hypothetical protein